MTQVKNEGYLGNINVKRAGVEQGWTQDQVDEYIKCSENPNHFIENYVKIISLDEGLVNFRLYDYQERLIDHFHDNRFSVCLACRQSGKSITVCAYLLWYVCFHPEQTVAVLANKGSTAREMLARITTMLEHIPFFLQPGTKVLNKGSINFENNSRIIASATSAASIRGLSVNLLYLDEFAFVENAEVFYTGTYPVITSGKNSKVIVTSTANGVGNMFHKIWEGAITGSSQYKHFQVDWSDVPGRDKKWKEETIANTSQMQFEQEFGNSFLGTGRTLIQADTLLGMHGANAQELYGASKVYHRPKENHTYIMTVDVAEGKGLDYSAWSIIDITKGNEWHQVCTFRDNMISPLLLPDLINKWGIAYNNAMVIVENNGQGAMVCNEMHYNLEYDNMFMSNTIKSDGIGLRMTRKTKAIGCATLKEVLEENKLHIPDSHTIQELTTFVSKGQSWEADGGNHDDMVMTLVLFGWFVSTPLFTDMTDEQLKMLLFAERQREIEEDVLPFGIINSYNEEEEESFVDGEGDVWTTDRRFPNKFW